MTTNETFRGYVQSTAFNLSMGRTHIMQLALFAQGVFYPRHNAGAVDGLLRRGLIEALPPDAVNPFVVTRAGKLVLELIDEAGLLPEGFSVTPRPTFPPPGKVKPCLNLDGPATHEVVSDGFGGWDKREVKRGTYR